MSMTVAQRSALRVAIKENAKEIKRLTKAADAVAKKLADYVAKNRAAHQAPKTLGYSPGCMYEKYFVGYYEAQVSQLQAQLATAQAMLTGARLNLQACQGGVVT